MFEPSSDGCSLVRCCQDELLLHISDTDRVFAVMIELLKKKHSMELSQLCPNQHRLEISLAYSAASKPTKRIGQIHPRDFSPTVNGFALFRAGSRVLTQLFLLEQTKEFTSNEVAGYPVEAVSE